MNVNSYPSIFAIGHRFIKELFRDPVVVQEKVDGSQFSFMRVDGELYCRSRGTDINLQDPDKLFKKVVNVVDNLPLQDRYVYRAEYVSAAKHNVLTYNRVPSNFLVLFDVQVGLGTEMYLSRSLMEEEATRLNIDVTPQLYEGVIQSADELQKYLELESFLGGPKIEGVVVKNYHRFTQDKKITIGKFVSDDFKEQHRKDWGAASVKGNIVNTLIDQYRTEARWRKAIQHLNEYSLLEGSPRDIGRLMAEIPVDIKEDSEEDIKDALFKHFWPQIKRGVTSGFPEFYKRELESN